DGLGRVAVTEASELASDIVINSLAGALREETGRLGSYVVMKLTSDAAVHPRLDAAIATTRARIDLMRGAMTNYGAVFLPGTGIDAAIDAVEDGYFRGALPYAERIAALRSDEPRPDTDTFTRAYVPGMKPVEVLRDRVVTASRQTLERLHHQSYLMVLASLLLTAVAVLAIIAIALVFRDGLFRPLMAAHRQIPRPCASSSAGALNSRTSSGGWRTSCAICPRRTCSPAC
ncbi:MAG: periplasmic sensor diguanylate cyclase, partial [Xanthobacteraceae bacterium]